LARPGYAPEALTGQFDYHHAFLLAKTLSRIDAIQADIDGVDAQIEVHPPCRPSGED
jgi:hypothetical protein